MLGARTVISPMSEMRTLKQRDETLTLGHMLHYRWSWCSNPGGPFCLREEQIWRNPK